jgi:tRNA threonylcarbamoyladenosine biosynthesis protein TsaE
VHSPDLSAPLACSCFPLPDPAATDQFGSQLAPLLDAGTVIWLEGDLGAGKTALVRALLRALGHQGPVKSPTYALVEVYAVSSLYFYHFDFYRFGSPEEFLDAGMGEYFRADAVCLVEWPDKAAGFVPSPDMRLCFRHAGAGRLLDVTACSEKGATWLNTLNSRWPAADCCKVSAPPSSSA